MESDRRAIELKRKAATVRGQSGREPKKGFGEKIGRPGMCTRQRTCYMYKLTSREEMLSLVIKNKIPPA